MANIKTTKQFQQVANKGVGATYGERKANASALPQARPVARKPVDQFSKGGTAKASHLTGFNANAAYKSGLKRFVGTAPRAIHNLQNGLNPPKTISQATPPTDDRILNFLDKVIASPELKDSASVKKQALLQASAQKIGK